MDDTQNDIEYIKSLRIAGSSTRSPQEVSELQQKQARMSMMAYWTDTFTAKNEVHSEEESNEQNQDSKQPNEWTNPKTRGRLKPTRKGNT